MVILGIIAYFMKKIKYAGWISRVLGIAFIGLFSGFFQVNSVSAKVSNDPNFYQWAYKDAGIYDAWDWSTGSRKVLVAVIDNGFDTQHPDLRNNVWKNEDEIPDNGEDDDFNGYIDDVWGWNFVVSDSDNNGVIDSDEKRGNNNPRPDVNSLADSEKEEFVFSHGTIVAGIIGGVGNNKKAGAGINWRVRLMNLKVVGNLGISSDLNVVAKAIRYAVVNGADVINLSMVGPENLAVKKAIQYAYKRGVVVVAAAGNGSYLLDENDPIYPICADDGENAEWVIGVSAVSELHRLASFSNIGKNCIDITAPGTNISSTVRYSPKNGLKEMYLGGWNGTSFAAPMVSGVAALIKSVRPSWRAPQITKAILSTVHHTPSQDEDTYANLYGAGFIQADRAVEYAVTGVIPPSRASVIGGFRN